MNRKCMMNHIEPWGWKHVNGGYQWQLYLFINIKKIKLLNNYKCNSVHFKTKWINTLWRKDGGWIIYILKNSWIYSYDFLHNLKEMIKTFQFNCKRFLFQLLYKGLNKTAKSFNHSKLKIKQNKKKKCNILN